MRVHLEIVGKGQIPGKQSQHLCTTACKLGCSTGGGSCVTGKQGWRTMAKLQWFLWWVVVVMSNWTRKGGVYAFVSFSACANKTLGALQKTVRPLAAVNYSI